MNKILLIIPALLVTSFTLSACATVKGVGKDITSVGEAGEDAIKRR